MTTVWLDNRVGSRELLPFLRQQGVYADLVRLDYADVAFGGNGPDGKVMVGIERKTVGDLVGSMTSKQFAGHQLPGLLDDYHVVYLLVEGWMRPSKNGLLEELHSGRWRVKRRGSKLVTYRAVDGWLSTMESVCGVRVRHTLDILHTAHVVRNLSEWWARPWADHDSHQAVYAPVSGAGPVAFVRPNIVWKMAAQLPGVEKRGREIARRFTTPLAMCEATEKDWRAVKGVGKVLAGNIVKLLRGCEDG